MKFVFMVLAVLFALAGRSIFTTAGTIMQEIAGILVLLGALLALCTSAVLWALSDLTKAIAGPNWLRNQWPSDQVNAKKGR